MLLSPFKGGEAAPLLAFSLPRWAWVSALPVVLEARSHLSNGLHRDPVGIPLSQLLIAETCVKQV